MRVWFDTAGFILSGSLIRPGYSCARLAMTKVLPAASQRLVVLYDPGNPKYDWSPVTYLGERRSNTIALSHSVRPA